MEPFLVQNREIHTTGSFGISMFPRDGNNAMDLFRSADIAMYKAKIWERIMSSSSVDICRRAQQADAKLIT
ncbi:MAG: diguanylate cyclase [Firmicutes bacterium]|jgi:GGDEF domain-containing protein|nr:diguanylate cyclase [Bacillota bacterium]